jgi:hypothetical protein
MRSILTRVRDTLFALALLSAALVALTFTSEADAQIDPAARGLAVRALTQNADPRIRSSTPSLREIGNRVGINNQISGSNTRAGFRTWEVNYVAAAPVVCLWNGYSNSSVSGVETGSGGVMTPKLYIEYGGTTYPLTWGGAAAGTIASNAVGCADPAPVVPPAYTKYRICGDIQMAGSGRIMSSGWSNSADPANGDEYQVGTTSDYCASGTALAKTASTAIFPQLVLGQSDRMVWGIIGDSITAGVNYTQQQASGGRGLFAALAEFGPVLNYGVPGDRATWYAVQSAIRRQMLAMGGIGALVDELGVNDITSSRTAANLLADRATIRGLFAGLSVYETTVMPTASSSDGFKTAANQTMPSSSSVRTSFNGSMRAGVTGVAGLLDFAAEVETSTASETGPVLDGGAWIPACMVGGDGTHPLEQCERQRIAPLVRALQATRR